MSKIKKLSFFLNNYIPPLGIYKESFYNPLKEWDYKDYHVKVFVEKEKDVEKLWFLITKPDGTQVTAPLSPYLEDFEEVNRWVDDDIRSSLSSDYKKSLFENTFGVPMED